MEIWPLLRAARHCASCVTAVAILFTASAAEAAPGDPLFPAVEVAPTSRSGVVANDASGDFAVVWPSPSANMLYGRLYAANGTPKAAAFPIVLSSNYVSNPAIAMNGSGDFVVLWVVGFYENGKLERLIQGQRLSGDGSLLGAVFEVARIEQPATDVLPAVAMDADGDFVVAWSRTRQRDFGAYYTTWLGSVAGSLHARRYKSSGEPAGLPILVESDLMLMSDIVDSLHLLPHHYYHTYDLHLAPALAMDDNGDFVIAWENGNLLLGNVAVEGKRYGADGLQRGLKIRVSPPDQAVARLPAAGMDAAGNFVIAWAGAPDASSPLQLYLQRYAANGRAQGDRIAMDGDVSGAYWPSAPALAMQADGEFVISWLDNPDGDPYVRKVYAQCYGSDVGTQGGSILIDDKASHDAYASTYAHPWVAIDGDGDFTIAWNAGPDTANAYTESLEVQRFACH